ncbi:MAG: hypothetical protein IIU08_01160 [Clostridia bacterium]|nr:hypothetical protein [Clostridia bacterium]
MRGDEFLRAMAYLSPDLIEKAGSAGKVRAPLWKRFASAAAVLFLAAGILFLVPYLFLPDRAGEERAKVMDVRVGDKLARYLAVPMSRFDRRTAEGRVGEQYEDRDSLYRVKGADDLTHLLFQREDGEWEMYRFFGFQPYLTEEGIGNMVEFGFIPASDGEKLSVGTPYTFGDVLERICGAEGPGDLESVMWEKPDFDRSKVGKSVRVEKTVTRDREDLAYLYEVFRNLVCAPPETDPPGRVWADSGAYLAGEKPLSVQTERKVTLRLKSGAKIELCYSPADGVIYQDFSVLYEPLKEEDNRRLTEMAGIDLAWRDWGRNPKIEGAETASPPKLP